MLDVCIATMCDVITISRMSLSAICGPTISSDASGAPGKCLVVLLHGIYGHVFTMHRLFTDIRKLGINVCAPRMASCNLSAEACADIILPIITRYVNSHDNASVILVGLSNGGRVACFVEHAMRQACPRTPVLLMSVAGAVTGTVVIDDNIGACLIDRSVRQQLGYRSRESLDLIERLREPLPRGVVRHHIFYATCQDQLVRPIESALPDIRQNEQHFLLDGCGHLSIMDVVHNHVMLMIQSFIFDLFTYDRKDAMRPSRTCRP